ncbi:MAG: ABC transporter permease [Gemmatimonadaceae bacterium]|nr:ABC transporter permease [Gemmatimonadaceae bacterium]
MAKLWAIIKREYLERVRSKWFLIGTFLGPVFFGAIIIVPAYIASKSKAGTEINNTVILDVTQTGFGNRLAAVISGGPAGKPAAAKPATTGAHPSVRVIPPAALPAAESTATHEVMILTHTGYLVVDGRTIEGESVRYAGRSATSIPDMERLRSAVKEAVLATRLEKAGINASQTRDITFIPLNYSAERITEKGRGGSGIASVMFGFAIGFLLYMTIILYGQTVMSGVLEEKTNRVAEVVMSSVPTNTLLSGKVLGVAAVALTQQILWVLTTILMFKLRAPIMSKLGASASPFAFPSISPTAAVLLFLFFLLGFVFYASLYAAVGSSVNSEQEAKQAMTPVLLFIITTAVFIQPVLLNPTGTMARVLSLLPFSSPIIMPIRMAVTAVPPWELGVSLVVLVLACFGAMWVASRIYRIGLLMYGKKPSFRELGRWITYSG